MKTFLIAALLLASVHVQAQTDISTIPTLKLFDGQISGDSTQFYGEVHIPEPMAYWGMSSSGFVSVDYSLAFSYDTEKEKTDHYWYLQRVNDLLGPVNEARASSAQVAPGYCAILTDGNHFSGRWNVLGPTSLRVWEDLRKYSYAKDATNWFNGSFDNVTRSVAVYKMLGSGCKPEADIPMLLDANRRMFPLVVGKGTRDKAIPNEPLLFRGGYVASRFNKYLEEARDANGWTLYLGGGFSAVARTLTVPQCYTVTLQYRTSATGTGHGSANFPAGTYTLANHGIAKVLAAAVERYPGCVQAQRPAPLISNGFCIHPKGGSATPGNNTPAIFHSDGCGLEPRLWFTFTQSSSLRHATSGKCLHPSGGSSTPALNTPLVFHDGCDEQRLRFELTDNGYLRHVSSGLCAIADGWDVMAPQRMLNQPILLKTCPIHADGGHKYTTRLNGTARYFLGVDGRDVTSGLN